MRGKKFLSGLLAAGLLFGGEITSALPSISVVAAEEDESELVENGLKYYIYTDEETDEEYAVITGYEGEPEEIDIPAEIGGKPVKSIGYNAFADCTSLKSVSIPAGIIKYK